MPILFQYLLKLSFSLAIMYLFYQLVLRRLTFYNHNRWYLTGYSLLCFFISFINISPILEKNEVARHEMLTFIPAVEALTTKVSPAPAMAEALGGWTLWSWLFVFLITGVGILLFRLILQLVSFKRLTAKAKLIADDEIKFYQVNENIIPFSFGNSIFINQHLHTEAELKEIIRHEFVHVKQRHTIDIVWSEILCILNWYNPFAWLIRKAIRQNLEFIADNKVVENGMDKKQYQYLLLKVIGNNHFSIASNFNFSSLKKRIAMMNKIRSAKVHLIKFLFVLPLAAVLLLSFREVISSDNKDITDRFNRIDTIPTTADVKRDSLVGEFLKRNTDIKDVGWVYDNVFNNKIVQIHIIKKSGTNEVYNVNDKSEMSEFEKKYGIYDDLLELNLVRKEGDWTKQDASLKGPSNPQIKITDKAQPLIIVDGVQWPEGLGVNIIDANKIDNIHVWKNEKAITMYGEKGKNGVMIITTKKQADANLQTDGIRLKERLPENVLYYLNGKQITKEAVDLLDPTKIYSVNVLKGQSAEKKYGGKAKNGAVEIITKLQKDKDDFLEKLNKGKNSQPSGTYKLSDEILIKENTTQTTGQRNADFSEMTFVADTLVWRGKTGEFELKGNAMFSDKKAAITATSTNAYFQSTATLVYIDGKEADLNKNYIGKKGSSYKVVTLKKEAAQKKYGEKGKNGAVEITTQPESKPTLIEKPVTQGWDIKNVLPGMKKGEC